jgi:hypothetical protein
MPPVFQAVAHAFRETIECFSALRRLSFIMLAILLAFQVTDNLLTIGPKGSTQSLLAGFVIGLAQSFFIVPYVIAVHRWVILREATEEYTFAPSSLRFQRFFWWSAALNTAIVLPVFLIQSSSAGPAETPGLGVMLVAMLIFVVVLIVALRLMLIFPAIAVDAPSADWDAVMADTRGYTWRIFWFGFLAGLPFIVVGIMVGAGLETAPLGLRVLLMMAAAVLNFAVTTLFVIVASRLYLWLGDRVNQA